MDNRQWIYSNSSRKDHFNVSIVPLVSVYNISICWHQISNRIRVARLEDGVLELHRSIELLSILAVMSKELYKSTRKTVESHT